MTWRIDTVGLASAAGTLSVAIPEDVWSFADKIASGVVVALVTAFVHAAGKALFRRWFGPKDPTLKA